jgi:hypothetical protein
MAKRVRGKVSELIVDRVLLVALLCAATSYIMRGSWAAPFFESAAIVLGVVWSARAMTTNPERTFRLMATLVLVLLWSLLAFYLGSAHGLL